MTKRNIYSRAYHKKCSSGVKAGLTADDAKVKAWAMGQEIVAQWLATMPDS